MAISLRYVSDTTFNLPQVLLNVSGLRLLFVLPTGLGIRKTKIVQPVEIFWYHVRSPSQSSKPFQKVFVDVLNGVIVANFTSGTPGSTELFLRRDLVVNVNNYR